ncbi:terminase [Dellaglioa algida]|nr:terminase [Dellaglioa algida]
MTKQLTGYKYVKDYFDAIGNGEILVCHDQYLLMDYLSNRVLNRDDVYLDEQAVENSIEIPKKYFPFELFLWQKFIQTFIYGLRWKKSNELVFNIYFIYVGRGSGKNGWIAWNSFYLSSGKNGINNYNVELNATSEEQAKTSFEDVYNVLTNNPKLDNVYKKRKEQITNLKTKSHISFNTSNARTKDGKRPGANVFDEVHEYSDYKSISVATSGGGKVKDYREFYITTDGNVRGGPLDDLKEESRSILNNELGIDKEGAAYSTMFPFIFRLDSPDEVDDMKNWEKASPSFNLNQSLKTKMMQEYSKMQRNSALRIEFMTKRMNSPIEDTRFALADYEDVLKTQNEDLPDDLSECIGGIDYAEIRDFCSVGLFFKNNGKTYWKQHTFIYYKSLELQNINPEIIELAIEKGNAEIVHGRKIEPSTVVDWYIEQAEKYFIKEICMDEFRATYLAPLLKEAGFKVKIVRRGRIEHSRMDPILSSMFIDNTLFFGDDPLMRWYTMNVYKHFLVNDNVEYLKIEKESRKTDGFFAFTHAMVARDDLIDYGEYGDDDGTEFVSKPLVF